MKQPEESLSTLIEKMKTYPAFYQKVWHACALIPEGETRSYGWIAKQIGSPRAARAVGQALAANPFAPMIPCHRVIASNGALTGYSAPGGIVRKRQMLLAERRTATRQRRPHSFS
jgi:methylated-DNA-[protein]-cysteine S-methyltransferase